MNNKFYFSDLFAYLLKKWLMLLCVLLIAALLGGAYGLYTQNKKIKLSSLPLEVYCGDAVGYTVLHLDNMTATVEDLSFWQARMNSIPAAESFAIEFATNPELPACFGAATKEPSIKFAAWLRTYVIPSFSSNGSFAVTFDFTDAENQTDDMSVYNTFIDVYFRTLEQYIDTTMLDVDFIIQNTNVYPVMTDVGVVMVSVIKQSMLFALIGMFFVLIIFVLVYMLSDRVTCATLAENDDICFIASTHKRIRKTDAKQICLSMSVNRYRKGKSIALVPIGHRIDTKAIAEQCHTTAPDYEVISIATEKLQLPSEMSFDAFNATITSLTNSTDATKLIPCDKTTSMIDRFAVAKAADNTVLVVDEHITNYGTLKRVIKQLDGVTNVIGVIVVK